MKVRTLAAVAALALGTVVSGGAAHATTQVWNITVDGCGCFGSGVTELGTVQVSDAGGMLAFTVTLDNGAVFNNAGQSAKHNAFVFNLDFGSANTAGIGFGSPTTIPTGFVGEAIPGSYNAPPPGSTTWGEAVDNDPTNNGGSNPTTLSFTVSDTANNLSLSMLTSPGNGGTNPVPVMFGVDVLSNGKTGNVFAPTQPSPGVPEPATWGLMITGVFFIGAAMRQRRHRALATA